MAGDDGGHPKWRSMATAHSSPGPTRCARHRWSNARTMPRRSQAPRRSASRLVRLRRKDNILTAFYPPDSSIQAERLRILGVPAGPHGATTSRTRLLARCRFFRPVACRVLKACHRAHTSAYPGDPCLARPGHGEFVPAAKVSLNEQGAIVSEDYSDDLVRLSNVVGK